MNKAELINQLAEKIDVTKKQAEDMIEAFVDLVTTTLQGGGEVTIAGFGTFSAKTRKGRLGVNPQHPDQPLQIPSVTVAKFKVGSRLKAALKEPKAPPAPPSTPPAPATT